MIFVHPALIPVLVALLPVTRLRIRLALVPTVAVLALALSRRGWRRTVSVAGIGESC